MAPLLSYRFLLLHGNILLLLVQLHCQLPALLPVLLLLMITGASGPATDRLEDLHTQSALGHVPDHAGLPVVPLEGHALCTGSSTAGQHRFLYGCHAVAESSAARVLTFCTAALTLMST
jgi:hypothetical protein